MLLQFSAAQGAASKAASLPIPITLPVAQSGTITFANAEANFAAIPEAAWQRTQDVIAANPAVNVPTEIQIGPNTKASKTAITDGLDRINKLFAGFRHVSAYAGIVYNAKDLNWAQGATAAYLKKIKVSGEVLLQKAQRDLVRLAVRFKVVRRIIVTAECLGICGIQRAKLVALGTVSRRL